MFSLTERGRKDPFSSEIGIDSLKWNMIGSRGGKHSGRSQDHAGSRSHGSSHSSGGRSSGGSSHSSDRGSHHASMGDLSGKFGGHDYSKTTEGHHDGGKTSVDTGFHGMGTVHGVDPNAPESQKGSVTAGGERDTSGRNWGGGGRGSFTSVPSSYASILSGDITGQMYNTPTTLGQRPTAGYNKYGDYGEFTINHMLSGMEDQDRASEAYDRGHYGTAAAYQMSSWANSALSTTSKQVDSIGNDPVNYAVDFTRSLPGKMLVGGLTGMTGLTIAGAAQLAQDAYGYASGDLDGQQAVSQALSDVGGMIGGIQGYVAAQASKAVSGDFGAVAGSMTGQMAGNMAAQAFSGLDPLSNALVSNLVGGMVNTTVSNAVNTSATSGTPVGMSHALGSVGGGNGGGDNTLNTGFNPEDTEISNISDARRYIEGYKSSQTQYQVDKALAQREAANVFGNTAYGFSGEDAYGFQSPESQYVLWGQ